MDRNDEMNLLIALTIVLLTFFSATFAGTEELLSGRSTFLPEEIAQENLVSEQGLAVPATKSYQNGNAFERSELHFLETVFSTLDENKKEEVFATLESNRQSPFDALTFQSQKLVKSNYGV